MPLGPPYPDPMGQVFDISIFSQLGTGLSGETSIFGGVSFVSTSPLGIVRKKNLQKLKLKV